MNKKVAVLGSGQVGEVLANGFLKHGHSVMRASREPDKLAAWKQGAGANASTGDFGAAARWADIVVLAVKGDAASKVIELAGADNLRDKTVIDATNPIAEGAPDNGVIRYFTEMNDSLMERLQRQVPAARFVKAFSSVGNAFMVNPDFGGVRPTMFICGDHAGAKGEVTGVLEQFGWDTEDMGGVQSARAIEPLCMLWCIPGMLRGQWSHVFKLLKK